MLASRAPTALVAATLAAASCARTPTDLVPPTTVASARVSGADAGSRGEPAVTGWRVLSRASTRALATDEQRVYFGDERGGALFAVPKTGGERVAIGVPAPRDIVLDAGSVVWIGAPGNVVVRAPQTGGPGAVIRDRGTFTALAADGPDVYVAEATGAGGTLSRITGPKATAAAVFDTPPRALVMDDTHVYVQTPRQILRVARASGEVGVVLLGAALSRLALDQEAIYTTDEVGPSRAIVRVPKLGGKAVVLEHALRDAPIARFGDDVYYFEQEQPTLRRVSAHGGASTIVARSDDLAQVTALAIDPSGIFVGIERLPKPERDDYAGGMVIAMPVASMPGASNALADADVTAAVLREVQRDPTIGDNVVEVVTKDGVVDITGTVDNLLAKQRATRHAEAVRGVRVVANRVSVQPQRVDDTVLARRVKDALHANAATEDFQISARAKNGVVTLKGNVHSYEEWAAAERMASRTRGVVRVDNQIEMDSPTQRADEELAHDVQERLRWDVLVEGRLDQTQVKAGKVFLRGVVGSAAEKRRATLDAWVDGVREVDASQLKVESWPRRDDLRKDVPAARSDAEVERAIRVAMVYDPRLGASAVQPTSRSGLVTLRGTARSLEAKRTAGQLARHTVGVVDVENEIVVDPTKRLPDGETAKRVTTALAVDPYTSHDHVVARADRGKVTLTGSVDSSFERDEAEHVAASVRGVSLVDNKLVVTRPSAGFVYDPDL
jgi:osmotically-inducible protein OsmY